MAEKSGGAERSLTQLAAEAPLNGVDFREAAEAVAAAFNAAGG